CSLTLALARPPRRSPAEAGVRNRPRIPPFFRAAFEGGFVNNAESTTDAEKFDSVFRLQVAHDRRDFFYRIRERLGVCNLRTDMHLHADDVDVAHVRSALVNPSHAIERNAELVLA